MKPRESHITRRLKLGHELGATELSQFYGGVVAGGCVPDPIDDAFKKKNTGPETVITIQIQ